jgi:hypothetical protein
MHGAVFATLLSLAAGDACCKTCADGYEKYYSIPNPDEAAPQCGECCLQPSRYTFWKLFEPKLLKGDCVSLGFTKYNGTETDGIGPLSVTNDRYLKEVAQSFCPDQLSAVYADMHDGDQKKVMVQGRAMTIEPSGNDETWVVHAELDRRSCSASVDFNVPGKPGPPPVNLTLSLWQSRSASGTKTEFEFTDPSGTLAEPEFPLNRWVELKAGLEESMFHCPRQLSLLYADMHDGDKKALTVQGSKLQIKPSGNDETWVVDAVLDTDSCSAVIDFNVPGKPGPPPVNLTATFWYSQSAKGSKSVLEFTDPTGTLAEGSFPLNHWVEFAAQSDGMELVV